MLKANGKIITRSVSKHRDVHDLQQKSIHVLPVSRWISYLILIPASLATFALTAFFFSVFLALFLTVGLTLAIWIGWLRWKLSNTARIENVDETTSTS